MGARWRWAWLSAAALYATFQVGDRFARRFVPTGERDIEEIYALRELRPRVEIAARLATIVGPAEELFWRGMIQSVLMERYGRARGAALGTIAYGGVHIVTGNFTLFGAARSPAPTGHCSTRRACHSARSS